MNAATAVVTVLVALLFAAAAAMKLTAQPRSIATRDRLGVSPATWRALAGLEVAGTVGVLAGLALPALGIAAALGLVALSIGALGAHLVRLHDPVGEAAPAIAALSLSVAALALLAATV